MGAIDVDNIPIETTLDVFFRLYSCHLPFFLLIMFFVTSVFQICGTHVYEDSRTCESERLQRRKQGRKKQREGRSERKGEREGEGQDKTRQLQW